MRRRVVFGLIAALFLLAGLDGGASSDTPATLAGSIRITNRDPLFGGFSAITLAADGRSFVAVSDGGAFVQGRIGRDAAGDLKSVFLGPIERLRGPTGNALTGRFADSEGLAIGPDGTRFVSFEHAARISRYREGDARAVDLPDNPAFARLPKNEGIEALGLDAAGTLYAVPEVIDGAAIKVHVFQGGFWRAPLSLPRVGRFNPVAADFGPDGRFYVLERRFHGLGGFASRLRRFDLGPTGFSNGVVLLQTTAGQHDNLEGLSIWRSPDGLRAAMISDDNFFPLQVTEIVEYRLPD